MKKEISILALSMVVSASSAFASGWRIPEQSVNSTGLSAAYVANASGADASYFNPANMVFDPETANYQVEFALNYIHLTAIEFDNYSSHPLKSDAESEKENFFVPVFHLVSPEYKDFRFGLSLTTPGGLSKRWEDSWAKGFAEEFTLETVELNPTMAYKVTDWFSIGGGVRAIFSRGKVVSSDLYLSDDIVPGAPGYYSRKLDGDSIDFGYNLALTMKPADNLTTAITWRSRVDLNLDGNNALLTYQPSPGITTPAYTGGGEVSVPVPGFLTVAAAYTIQATTIELTWDRTFWSDYDELDFDYGSDIASYPHLEGVFGTASPKNYKDTDAYRIGITQKLMDDKLTLMFGFAIDENPIPEETLGFELPDSDAKIYSCGFRYKLDETYEVGMSFLYDQKEKRKVTNTHIDGEFSNASAYMITTGVMVKF